MLPNTVLRLHVHAFQHSETLSRSADLKFFKATYALYFIHPKTEVFLYQQVLSLVGGYHRRLWQWSERYELSSQESE